VWVANTKALLGSASANYVEKYCPDMQISDVSWDSFVYGRSATVKVAVWNLGERGWTYTVEAWTEGGSAGRGSASVSVPAGASATATLSLPVTSFKSSSDTLVVRVSCAGGRRYVDKRYSVSVTPPRPGPFEFSASPVEARLGQEVVFSVGLKTFTSTLPSTSMAADAVFCPVDYLEKTSFSLEDTDTSAGTDNSCRPGSTHSSDVPSIIGVTDTGRPMWSQTLTDSRT